MILTRLPLLILRQYLGGTDKTSLVLGAGEKGDGKDEMTAGCLYNYFPMLHLQD